MPRKKSEPKKPLTPKELALNHLDDTIAEANRTGPPTYSYSVGESVVCGMLKDCIIDEVLNDGKIYGISFCSKDSTSRNGYMYVPWTDVRPIINSTNLNHFTTNEDIRICYLQQDIMSVIDKHYHFGVNFEPEYQRESVWDDNDRELLIESIFMGADIGKFVFVHYDDARWRETGCSYEILDGKQRLLTLLAFYENRFAYKGKYYNDLSPKDKGIFKRTLVSVGEIQDAEREKILRIFIILNRGGKVVDDKVIERAKNLLKEIEKNK